MLRAMEEASKTSGQTPWLHIALTEAIRLGSETGFGFSLFGKKDLSFFLSLIYI